jgi:hypothetical protein
MVTRRNLAILLVAVGAVALLSIWLRGALWLWTALLAGGLLTAYGRQKQYGLLVAGAIFTGIAVGLLLEFSFRLPGAFFVSLGVSFLAINRIEPRRPRWTLYLTGVLTAFGLLYGLTELGILGSWWFAALLIAAGVLLLLSQTKGTKSWRSSESETITGEAPSETLLTQAPQPTVQTTPQTADTLRAALEDWRRRVAQSENRAPYLILTNDSLEQIVTERPTTPESLATIKGIGPVKLERYGTDILKIVTGDT